MIIVKDEGTHSTRDKWVGGKQTLVYSDCNKNKCWYLMRNMLQGQLVKGRMYS